MRQFLFIFFYFQIKKMVIYIGKAVQKLKKQREKYEEALINLITCYPNYESEMRSAFLQCQRAEITKYRLFNLILLSITNSLYNTQTENRQFVFFFFPFVTVLSSMLSVYSILE